MTFIPARRRIGHNNMFPCIDKNHPDWEGDGGSMGIVRGNQNIIHCFGCGIKGDIFMAAALLENKPLQGKPFMVENLKYLAGLFGIEVPEMNLSADDLYEMKVKSAYAHASSILTSYQASDYGSLMQEKLAVIGWKDETRVKLGVGSVKSFSDYMDKMTKQYGYEVSFLQEIDLADSVLINENRLLFTVCDAYGAPVGFASRNLKFESESKSWKARADAILADKSLTEVGRSDAITANNRDRLPKYKNTSGKSKNVWYTKINLLFGFHIAKKAGAPLWVMEGYPDATTAHDFGMANVCAIGATAFTKEHVDVLIATGTKHIIVVLDGDNEGYKATDRAVKVIEEAVGERVGFRVELIQMPEGSDDPDRFIRLYGRADFEALPRMDIFSWKIRRQMQTGSDPIQLCTEAIPLIVNEPSHLLRLKAARSLAVATGVPEETILAEISRIVDQDKAKVAEEKALIITRMTSDLKRSPESAGEIIRQAQSLIENLDGAKEG